MNRVTCLESYLQNTELRFNYKIEQKNKTAVYGNATQIDI